MVKDTESFSRPTDRGGLSRHIRGPNHHVARLILGAVVFAIALFAHYLWSRDALGRRAQLLGQALIEHREYHGLAIDSDGLGNLIVKLVEAEGQRFVTFIRVRRPGFQDLERSFSLSPGSPMVDSPLSRFEVRARGADYVTEMEVLEHRALLGARLAFALGVSAFVVGLIWLLQIWYRRGQQMVRAAERERVAEQVAHDLRGPLMALRAGLDSLDADPRGAKDLLSKVSERLESVAVDVLRPGRAAKQGGLPWSEFQELLRELEAEMSAAYAGLQLSLKFGGAEADAPAAQNGLRLPGEKKKWQRLLANLITNAVESYNLSSHSERRVEISLHVHAGQVTIMVRDHGRGIPPEVVAKVGQRGFSYGKAEGKGLGLADARATMESWGGRLFLESVPDYGTRVTLRLPLVSRI